MSDSDNSAAAWSTWSAGGMVTVFALAPSPGDANLFFTSGGWSQNVYVLFEARVSGVPYYAVAALEETGPENRHDTAGGAQAYALDPIGLALSGILSQR